MELASGLPELTATERNGHYTFKVRKKTVGYYLNDHHGDGIVGIALKTTPEEQHARVEGAPERYYLPDYIAHHGFVALRLDGRRMDWGEVEGLLAAAYRIQAPKTLVARLDAERGA